MTSDTTATPNTSARRRWLLYGLTMTPILAIISLLAWGLIAARGTPGGLAVNNDPGFVNTSPRQAPSFDVATLDNGPQLTDEALRGKVVMIDFWSSWCGPCQLEAADLATVYQEFAGRPVEFLGIAIWDEPGDVIRHIQRYDVTYPNAIDDRGRIAVDFGVRGVPEKFFLNADGQVVRKFIGPMSKDQLRRILNELLAGQS
ncbi:MAG: TlpA family protein disulfide reductase [SAR202 cluster bacterium]|nr:TlpA family protein disulfide reductase [SAR202 cluster bacterium]